MLLDAFTVLICTSWLLAMLGLLFLALAIAPVDRRWATPWGLSFLLAAVGSLLLALRDSLAPFLNGPIAGAVLLCYGGMAWNGARLFLERTPNWWVLPIGPAVWLLLSLFPFFDHSAGVRLLTYSAISSAYVLATALELARGSDPFSHARRLAVVVLFLQFGLLILRGIVGLTSVEPTEPGRLPTSNTFTAFLLLANFSSIAIAFSIIAMARERTMEAEQRNLRAAAEAARTANETKSRFLARLSHELRTPLNSMLGFAQVLASDQRLHDEQRQQASTLAEGGRHLLNLLNDLVDLARMDAGKLTLSPAPLVLRGFLRQCVALSRTDAAARGSTIQLILASDLPRAVLADETRLRQVLLNLLSNAIKYGAANDKIELIVSPREGDMLRFTVADHGPGIAPALRQRLFEDYARLHLEGAGPSGAGLGLSICQALARAMGGLLSYADRPGGGSLFHLDLPLPLAEAPGEAEEPEQPASLKILVVEDLRPNRRVLRLMLEQAGHAVTEAAEMSAALTSIAGQTIDLVLLDLDAPGGEGLGTLKAIRDRNVLGPRNGKPVPVIGMTRHASAIPQQTLRERGLSAVVHKPVERDALLPLVAAHAPPGLGE
ncbi:response regulator [Acetobacteraceae bacterium H6797]|nr:response regulator [Acetobacteraceae bacterium H6797]